MSESRFFKARFNGKCAKCNEPFYEGDWVAYDDDHNLLDQKCIEEDDE